MLQKIFIVDNTVEVAERLQAALEGLVEEVQIISKFDELGEAIANESPGMLCVNSALLDKGRLPAAIRQQIPVLVYAFELDTQVESQLYELGVRRVIVEKIDLAEQVAAFVKMYQFQRQTLAKRRLESQTHGNLQTLPLAELLQNAMFEKKNLIIKIYTDEWNVKIRTFLGHVCSCTFGDKTGEEALLYALMLNAGSLTIKGYQKPRETAQMSASVPALLSEFQFIQHKIQHLLVSLGCGAGNQLIKTIKSDRIFELPKTQLKVLDLVEEHGTIGDVLLRSPGNLHGTIQLLKYFAENNFIEPAVTNGKTAAPGPATRAAQRQRIAETGISSGTIAVLGNRGRTDLINTIAGHDATAIRSVKSLEFTRLTLPNNARITVLGISTKASFLSILDKVSENMIGCVILLDLQDQTQIEFSSYLFNRIMQMYKTPFLVALTNINSDAKSAIQSYRKTINVPKDVDVIVIDPQAFESALKIFEKFSSADKNDPEASSVTHQDQEEEENV